MDSPAKLAMPNQRTIYVACLICRACGWQTENEWRYYYDDLPIFCPECFEHAMRPVQGGQAAHLDKAVPPEERGHSA